jgi:predicted LPLAT superfamily acyltransferase
MRAVGLYSPEAHRDYFQRVAEHLAAAMHIFRHVPPDSTEPGRPMAPALARIAREQVDLGDSVDVLRRAMAPGRGTIIVGAHVTNFLLILARLNEEIPLTVYLRHSRDPRKLIAKQRWCRATGLTFIAEPASTADPARRAATLADALAAGRVLVITPDIPQKDGNGVPVRFLDREIHLPNGPAALSVLTGAPLVSATGRPASRATRLVLEGPLTLDAEPKGRGARQAAIAARMQWFADRFSNYLRASPSLWFLWADNRWTRVFRGDPRFARLRSPAVESVPPPLAEPWHAVPERS